MVLELVDACVVLDGMVYLHFLLLTFIVLGLLPRNNFPLDYNGWNKDQFQIIVTCERMIHPTYVVRKPRSECLQIFHIHHSREVQCNTHKAILSSCH